MSGRRHGFTLIELLVTVFILAVGLTTVFALVTLTSRWSGEQVREWRREQFVDSVFASVEWSLTQREDAAADPWTLPVLVEDEEGDVQTLVVNGTDVTAWPRERGDGLGSELLRIYYRLNLSTNTLGAVEAELSVRMQGEPPVQMGEAWENRVFRRTFVEGSPLW